MRLERAVKLLFVGLAGFDLVLAVLFVFLGGPLFRLFDLSAYGEPRFFLICTGLFLLLYAYVQWMGAKDPRANATYLNLTVILRLTFPAMYTGGVLLWGEPHTVLHRLFLASAIGDLVVSAFVLYAMRRLEIGFFRGDRSIGEQIDAGSVLRLILLVLALAEFAIGLNWVFFPRFWLDVFGIEHGVDPFWTRATGVFLVNIAYAQFLGFLDPLKYRGAVVTSGLFRALWPVFYWHWTIAGAGNGLFKFSIMFFSIFDLCAFLVIFILLRRVTGGPVSRLVRVSWTGPSGAG